MEHDHMRRCRSPSIRGLEKLSQFNPREQQMVAATKRVEEMGGRVTAFVIARGKLHVHYVKAGKAAKLKPMALAT